MTIVQRITETLSRQKFSMSDEATLQNQISEVLDRIGLSHKREVWLSETDRIDFMCDEGVGIEVKIKGSAAAIARQLKRYESAPNLKHLILATKKSVDPTPAGFLKPVTVVWLSKAWL